MRDNDLTVWLFQNSGGEFQKGKGLGTNCVAWQDSDRRAARGILAQARRLAAPEHRGEALALLR